MTSEVDNVWEQVVDRMSCAQFITKISIFYQAVLTFCTFNIGMFSPWIGTYDNNKVNYSQNLIYECYGRACYTLEDRASDFRIFLFVVAALVMTIYYILCLVQLAAMLCPSIRYSGAFGTIYLTLSIMGLTLMIGYGTIVVPLDERPEFRFLWGFYVYLLAIFMLLAAACDCFRMTPNVFPGFLGGGVEPDYDIV
ncbi:uncharacterized protein LOC131942103 [Physella acuta]|uniref:uncharacterized protein LOC131942103 n=1 Tax=Physella acuta TaxID=109671 RepID=UPI0027DCA248|nr:uncharacterized protein LOC131942103 [Physella acuta]